MALATTDLSFDHLDILKDQSVDNTKRDYDYYPYCVSRQFPWTYEVPRRVQALVPVFYLIICETIGMISISRIR